MPSLRDVQLAFRRALVSDDKEGALADVVDDGLAPAQRLGIYRHTLDASLANALRLSYPAVHKLVGADFFEGAASIYVHQHPPRSSWLDAYGEDFPEFLESFAPAASLAYLADVARLERAVTRALHAPDRQPLDANLLAAVEPGLHERVYFVADPSMTLLTTAYPADVIWRGVLASDDSALAGVDLAEGPAHLLVLRADNHIEVARLDTGAWEITRALVAGQPLGVALDSAEASVATSVLADHLAHGRFVDFGIVELPLETRAPEIAA